MITLFDLLVVAAILGCTYWGWLVGLEAASVAALELLACLSVAVMLHEPLAGLFHAGFALAFGEWIGMGWSILLAFALLAWGTFALVRTRFHRPGEAAVHEVVEIDPLTDRLTGGVAGGIGGALLAGGALVTLSMVPFLAGFKPSGDRMLLDVGKFVLRVAGQFAGEKHEGRSLPLWGEPPSRMSVLTAGLTSDPWFDVDDDGTCTQADRFRDVDANGMFTKDLYFTDVDADGMRRIGLVDKYVAGRWDGLLRSDDRPRADLKKPAGVTGAQTTKPASAPNPVAATHEADKQPATTSPQAAQPSRRTTGTAVPDAQRSDATGIERKPSGKAKGVPDEPPEASTEGRRPDDDF